IADDHIGEGAVGANGFRLAVDQPDRRGFLRSADLDLLLLGAGRARNTEHGHGGDDGDRQSPAARRDMACLAINTVLGPLCPPLVPTYCVLRCTPFPSPPSIPPT